MGAVSPRQFGNRNGNSPSLSSTQTVLGAGYCSRQDGEKGNFSGHVCLIHVPQVNCMYEK